MKEQNQLNATNQTYLVGNFNETENSRLMTLDQVLLEEYKTLGILNALEGADIDAFRIQRGKELKIILPSEAEKLPQKEREEQFNLRQQRRTEVLKKIRERIHRSSAREFYQVYEKYEKIFLAGNEDKDFDEILSVSATLATLKELKEEIKTESKKDALKVHNQAVVLVEKNKNGEDALSQLETDVEKIKQKEISNFMTAICFSGGGIRSATFGLGILQSLAKHGLLDKFHYLSTVSGGGYIGSWLSAWIHKKGIEKVQSNLVCKELPEGRVEAPEITHLRSYSNYLSPRTGLFTTDTWTLIAVYLRNLLLNWTVFIPLIAALLLLPKLFVSLLDLLNKDKFPIGTDNFQIILELSPFAGWLGICCINMLRPSLKDYSYFHQTYRKDDIGVSKSSNRGVWLSLILILIFAFGFTIFWFWKQQVIPFILGQWLQYFVSLIDTNILRNIDLPFIQWQSPLRSFFLKYPEMADLTYLSVALFLGGYLLSWIIMLKNYIYFWKDRKKNLNAESNCFKENNEFPWNLWNWIKKNYKTYLSEQVFSIICGVIGGALLFLVIKNLNPEIYKIELYVCFGVPLFLMVFLLSTSIFTGLTVRITQDDDREWTARFSAVLLKLIVGWSVISSVVVFGPKLFELNQLGDWDSYIKTAGAVFATVSGLFSALAGFSSKTPANDEEPAKDWTSYLIPLASSILAPIFVLFLLILISTGTQHLAEITGLSNTVWFFILAIIGCVMGWFININKFSFHSTYRERLIRAYLGASNSERLDKANSFTGLNTENDNIELKNLLQKPFHVLNMTLNLVKSDNLAWQNRKAESFTATALHCGSSNMGEGSGNYRSSECYGFNKQNNKAITLGTALAISGAAASPNMGSFTQSSAVSFLMVLLNVRLGWWLGNPGKRGANTWKKAAPTWSPGTFFKEALGLTDTNHPYVYLADGGQFENLGLYEMVLRRCKTIVVCDGGSDAAFGFFDLGSAVHKINVDMGIPIKFDSNPSKGRNCSIATIRYSAVDGEDVEDGTLIYIKPTLDENQPVDIVQYKSVNPAFPHEGTLDQFYSETQFECYRKLGFNMMESICEGQEPTSVTDLKVAAELYLQNLNDMPAEACENLSQALSELLGAERADAV